jgi:hypothetical protein
VGTLTSLVGRKCRNVFQFRDNIHWQFHQSTLSRRERSEGRIEGCPTLAKSPAWEKRLLRTSMCDTIKAEDLVRPVRQVEEGEDPMSDLQPTPVLGAIPVGGRLFVGLASPAQIQGRERGLDSRCAVLCYSIEPCSGCQLVDTS